MKLQAAVILVSILTCSHAGLLGVIRDQNRDTERAAVLCKSLPLPSLETDDLLNKLQPYLDLVDQKVQAAFKDDNSTGGVVLSVVYRNATVWTKGYGLIDMSSESTYMYMQPTKTNLTVFVVHV